MVSPQIASIVRLNLGCGSDVRSGYVNVDKFPATSAVVQGNLPEIPFPDGHADEIMLSHVLEHFGYAEGLKLCREMVRVLKPRGLAYIEVPDIAWCCAQFLGAPELNGYTDPCMDYSTNHKWGLFAQAIWGDQHNDGLFHKWGYTAHRLMHTLRQAGFATVNIDFVPSHGVQCLSARAHKAGP